MRPRVLCLHGWRTNTQILHVQLTNLKNALPDWEFVVPDGTHPAKGLPVEFVQKVFPNQDYFEWWDAVTRDDTTTYEGLPESIAFIKDVFAKQGPFEAVLGFSQGATFTTLLTALTEKQSSDWPVHLRWNLSILFAGIPPRDHAHMHLFDDHVKLKTPSLVVYGEKDEYVDNCKRAVPLWDTPQVVVHEGGHVIPSKDPCVAQLARAIEAGRKTLFYALDFDGVICDSARETAMSGWKAAEGLIPGASVESLPEDQLVDKFVRVRPVLETGFEAVLLLHLLCKGVSVEEILADSRGLVKQALADLGITEEELKEKFHVTREAFMNNHPDEWLAAHGFYPGAVLATKALLDKDPTKVFIVTTKHKSFATKLLAQAGLQVPEDQVYGLGSGKKQQTLEALREKLGSETHMPFFLEDRKQTLKDVIDYNKYNCRLAFAKWGYNTDGDVKEMVDLGVTVLDQDGFVSLAKGV